MPSVTMILASRCGLCGCRLRGMRWASVTRVNKSSLVISGGSLVWVERTCVECGFPTAEHTTWRLDPESQTKIDAARARKGWPPL